jgi:NitT/TauT family transport system substrate-binding protein
MLANPKESAAILAKVYNLEPAVMESTLVNLIASEKKGGVPYWGPGDIRIDTMNNMIRAQKIVGAMQGDADWAKLIDESFLPDDLKSKKSR